jgi:23S rRNA-/tRNA-specific pseudouridylate synthase
MTNNITLEWKQPIPVLYQDENLVIVDKPSGLLVHAYKKESADKTNLLKVLSAQTGHYLYPLHRLDRPVSGPVAFGINKEVSKLIMQHWHHPRNLKEYVLLCIGEVKKFGQFHFDLNDENKKPQNALTEFERLHYFDSYHSLVRVRIKTGRKHQIRRHFAHAKHQLICDSVYGKARFSAPFKAQAWLNRIFLHCTRLKLYLPHENRFIQVHSKLPKDLEYCLDQLDQAWRSKLALNF